MRRPVALNNGKLKELSDVELAELTASTTFLGLADTTPATYTGAAGYYPRVNQAETALELAKPVHYGATEPSDPVVGTTWVNPNDVVYESNKVLVGGMSGRLITENTLLANATTIDITGLNSSVDGDYTLILNLINTGASLLSLSFNGNTTATNYYYIGTASLYGATTCENNYGNSNVVIGTSGVGSVINTYAKIEISKCSDGRIRSIITMNDFLTTGTRQFVRTVQSTFTVTDITSILLTANNANTILTGSTYRLYGSKTPAKLIEYTPQNFGLYTSDKLLKAGEVAYIDYVSATSIPLCIATEEGLYELTLLGNYDETFATGGIMLWPNNAQQTAGAIDFSYFQKMATATGSNSTAPTGGMDGGFTAIWLGDSHVVQSNVRISTFKKSKSAIVNAIYMAASIGHGSIQASNFWVDNTSSWTSLGTIKFPTVTAHTGKIVVRRII